MVTVNVSVKAQTVHNLANTISRMQSMAASFNLSIFTISSSVQGWHWEIKSPNEALAKEFEQSLPSDYAAQVQVRV